MPGQIVSNQDNQTNQRGYMELAKTKIFLLYASAGAGHETACRAIEQEISRLGFKGEVRLVDVLKFMPPIIADIFSRGYLYTASKLPWLWYALYERKSSLGRFKPSSPLQKVFWKLVLRRFNRYLIDEKPDYIVSAYFTSSWAAGRYKKVHNPQCKVATVVTDYGLHPAWLAPGQDRYFVATQDNISELADFGWYTGVSQDKIKVVGIPVERRFTVAKDKKKLREKYNLDSQRFTVLVLSGIYGKDHIEAIVGQLLRCQSRLQLFLVAGKNFSISDRLKEDLTGKDFVYRTFGRINFMEDLIAMADVVITKTGGLTSTECLVSGLPLLIYMPYPGQEERNCALFLEKGAALRVFQLESLPRKVDMLATNQQIYQAMVKAAKAIANHNAAGEIATVVLDDLKEK